MATTKRIDYPGVNGMAICDCKSIVFRVGIEVEHGTANHIRCLECAACGRKMAVPFQKGA